MDMSKKFREEQQRPVQACLSPEDEKTRNAPNNSDTSVGRHSPFSGIPLDKKSPLPSGKRDSGYVTDNSPATFSPFSHFTFELPPREEEPSQGAVGGRISPSSMDSQDLSRDVFSEYEQGCVLFENETDEQVDDSAFVDEVDGISDDDENEVNVILRPDRDCIRHPGLVNRQVSQPMAVPLSPPIADIALRNGVQAPFRLPGRYNCGVSSVGTQTPHVLCQIVHRVISEPFFNTNARGTAASRLRHRSDTEEYGVGLPAHPHGPLPDIIPHTRDRSISLPDMQALRSQRELEVGRELRRLSDDFNHSYCNRRRRVSLAVEMAPSNSFPGARRNPLIGFIDIFRGMFLRSPSPLDEDDDYLDPS